MLKKTAAVRPRLGFFCAIVAQAIWGFFPLFYDLLKSINSLELVAHRAVWGFTILASTMLAIWLIPAASKQPLVELKNALADRRTFLRIVVAALLVGVNWILFVWAVTHHHVLEASLGYYICPQVNVLLGVVVLRERLLPMQWMAVGLAACGVAYISSSSLGFPWISVILATAFGLYGLVKKQTGVAAVPGMTIETGILVVPAMAYFCYRGLIMEQNLVASPWWLNVLFVASGLLTVSALAFYATALKHIPLSTVGLLQFVGPSLQFFCSVYLLGEPFDRTRLIGFIFVWIALALFLSSSRKPKTAAAY